MSSTVYVLVISVIAQYGQGGFTEAIRLPTLEKCILRETWIAEMIRSKKVSEAKSQCLEPSKGFTPPKVVRLVESKKPEVKAVKVQTKTKSRVTAKPKKKRVCASKRYRVVNGKRKWYCKRYK